MKMWLGLTVLIGLVACRRDMNDQARYAPLKSSDFFANGAASRVPPAHTVAQTEMSEAGSNQTGKISEKAFVTLLPVKLTPGLLKRGQERYNIFCSVCHGRTGTGDGVIVQRGFPRPPSFAEDRLRIAPVGHFFEVMTHGYGVMYSYASRVEIADRWAIAAYIRALQLSQHGVLADVPASEREKLEAAP